MVTTVMLLPSVNNIAVLNNAIDSDFEKPALFLCNAFL